MNPPQANVLRLGWGPLCLALSTLALFAPTLGYPFLQIGFDDPAFVTEHPAVGPFNWHRFWLCFSTTTLHDYLPIPVWTYLVDFQLWGLWPGGYHLTNVLLHLATAWLVQSWVQRLTGDARAGLLAALVFALHPVQVETVAVVAQRKTILSTGFVLLSLLAYDAWLRGEKRHGLYAASLLAYLAACLSKSSVTPFPLLLLWYEYWFFGRVASFRDKTPFFLIAGLTAGASVLTKWGEVIKPPHGDALTSVLIMGRIWWEYVLSVVFPAGLSPAYYYQRASIASPVSVVAFLAGVGLVFVVWRYGRKLGGLTFCLGWVAISLLPVSNIVPIAVLRADRYLYLPMVAVAYGVAEAVYRSEQALRTRGLHLPVFLAALTLVGVLAVRSAWYLPTFRDDVAARTRAVALHPWAAPAHYLLAISLAEQGAWEAARGAAEETLRLDANFERARELLTRLPQGGAESRVGGGSTTAQE